MINAIMRDHRAIAAFNLSTGFKLINIIVRNGNTIEPGQFIISGAMGAMLPADPGSYTADFGSFGKIDFVVKKPE